MYLVLVERILTMCGECLLHFPFSKVFQIPTTSRIKHRQSLSQPFTISCPSRIVVKSDRKTCRSWIKCLMGKLSQWVLFCVCKRACGACMCVGGACFLANLLLCAGQFGYVHFILCCAKVLSLPGKLMPHLPCQNNLSIPFLSDSVML